MAFKLSYQNSGGELDYRVVATQEDTLAAGIELIAGMGFLCDGDKLIVTEVEAVEK